MLYKKKLLVKMCILSKIARKHVNVGENAPEMLTNSHAF